MKTCKKCSEVKPPASYRRHGETRDGLQGTCRACEAAHKRTRTKAARQAERARRAVRVGKDYRPGVLGSRPTTGAATRARLTEQRNARQAGFAAWLHWVNERAPDWWVVAYWEAKCEPWRNPRLTDAEQFSTRYRLDPDFNLRQRMRAALKRKRQGVKLDTLVRGALVRGGTSPTAERFLGYTVTDLRLHLERQFTRRMDWQRFCQGDIHIDHIVPLSSFDLSNPDELRRAWALTNLRPLWARDNLAKAAVRSHLV